MDSGGRERGPALFTAQGAVGDRILIFVHPHNISLRTPTFKTRATSPQNAMLAMLLAFYLSPLPTYPPNRPPIIKA